MRSELNDAARAVRVSLERALRHFRPIVPAFTLMLLASGALTQDVVEDKITTSDLEPVGPETIENAVATENGVGASLRMLDFLSGRVDELEMSEGQSIEKGFLTLELVECRFPAGNPNSDAFARLVITDRRDDSPRFNGWMVASSPALSALEHPRYDVWVIRCTTSEG
ncbi:MAG: DUF2155 domain-containing protein [Rhodobacteraceae bacterium]|nr:DUF2155 domain-containing protein [Paracoccaceae bacterium]MCY4138063.1 DUF2155 domain-containing protein [Paracoccaceae bacterium]